MNNAIERPTRQHTFAIMK